MSIHTHTQAQAHPGKGGDKPKTNEKETDYAFLRIVDRGQITKELFLVFVSTNFQHRRIRSRDSCRQQEFPPISEKGCCICEIVSEGTADGSGAEQQIYFCIYGHLTGSNLWSVFLVWIDFRSQHLPATDSEAEQSSNFQRPPNLVPFTDYHRQSKVPSQSTRTRVACLSRLERML